MSISVLGLPWKSTEYFQGRIYFYSRLHRHMASATNKIGEHLLRGWALLGDSCPHECNVPLMRSPDKKSLICFGCGTDFLAVAADLAATDSREKDEAPASNKSDGVDCPSILRDAVREKLGWCASQVSNSTNVDDLSKILVVTEKLLHLHSILK
jgi:uncharacterized Zn finger protein (UPF0148 family)